MQTSDDAVQDPAEATELASSSSSSPPTTDELVCPVCSRRFTGSINSGGLRSNFRRHMLLHSGDRPFQCSECAATFTTSGNLRRHCQKRHPVVDSGDTLLCNKETSAAGPSARPPPTASEPSVDTTLNTVITSTIATFPCRVGCGRVFTWKATRTVHEKRCGVAQRRDNPAEADEQVTAHTVVTELRMDDTRAVSAPLRAALVPACGAPVCDAECTTVAPSLHRPTVVPPAVPTYVCCNCEASFVSRTKLRRHEVLHCPFRPDAHDDDELFVSPATSSTAAFPDVAESVRMKRLREVKQELVSGSDSSDCRERVAFESVRRTMRLLLPCPHCAAGGFRKMRLLRAHIRRCHPAEWEARAQPRTAATTGSVCDDEDKCRTPTIVSTTNTPDAGECAAPTHVTSECATLECARLRDSYLPNESPLLVPCTANGYATELSEWECDPTLSI